MLPRPCLDCGVLVMGASRCTVCARKRDRARGTSSQRGYGAAHQALREQWRSTVDAGFAVCRRCGHPIRPGESWDLDHADDGSGYLGPSHARCNRAAPRRGRTADFAQGASAPQTLTQSFARRRETRFP